VRLNPDVPDELERAISKCLEKDKDLRYQSASDLRADLKRLKRDTSSGESVARAAPRPGRRRSRVLPWLGAGALVVASAFGWWSWSRRSPQVPAQPLKIAPFAAADAGPKQWPQLSPDGEKVAYGWRGPDDDNWDIYVKALGVGTKPFRLTEHPADEFGPVWSPDGRQIAFVRVSESGGATYAVPSLGGQERRLTDGNDVVRWGDPVLNLSWSPDGKWLAFGEKPSQGRASRIVRVSLDTREKQPLTSPPEDTQGDRYPSFSPDGTLLAFIRSGSGSFGAWDVWVERVGEGTPRRLTHGKYDACRNPVWISDGSEILFTTGLGDRNIHRVNLAGGEPQPAFGVGAGFPSIRGSLMVYQKVTQSPMAIWRVGGRRTSTRNREPQKLIASSQDDHNAAYSPDGRRIAFQSGRGGGNNIWVCDSDGRKRSN
jgi:Tol biopolymer transport system component